MNEYRMSCKECKQILVIISSALGSDNFVVCTNCFDALLSDVRALVDAAKDVTLSYKNYRIRGYLPSPDQYAKMVEDINKIPKAIAAVEARIK